MHPLITKDLNLLVNRLQNLGPHFCLVKARSKDPSIGGGGWQKLENLMSADDTRLQEHLKHGGNYGVVGGSGLVILDADTKEIKRLVEEKLPETFTVESPGSKGWHSYYLCGLEKPIRLRDKDGENVGDIQGPGKMVVGPGSVHPNGGVYRIVKDLPLAQVTKEQLVKALDPFVVPDREIDRVEAAARMERKDSNLDLDVLQVVPLAGLRKRGPEYFGSHPVHGSKTGVNFWVNTSKNCWHCFRHGTGGGPFLWLAVEEGIIGCEEAGPGALRGEVFKKVLEKAQEKGLAKGSVKTKKKQHVKVEDTKKAKTRYLPFIELPDGRLAEQGFDGKTSFFLVYDTDTDKIEKAMEIELEDFTICPIDNNEVADGTVLLPSDALEYESEEQLMDEILGFLNRWHESPNPLSRTLDGFYVFLTYIKDLVPQLPYRRYLAPWGRGKSAWLETLGWICYRGLILAGSDTDKSVVRKMNNWRGTALIDEADFGDSSFYAFLVKILNIGYDRKTGFYHRSDDNNPNKVLSYNVYGPKLLATRAKYKDLALESRCLTTVGRQNLNPIPLFRMDKFQEEAQTLRNKLILWRFRNYHRIKEEAAKLESSNIANDVYEGADNISSRVKQVILPLWLIGGDPIKETLSNLAKRIDDHLKIEDPNYLLELQAKEAVKEILQSLESEEETVNISNVVNILYEGPQDCFYEIPLSVISRTILKQHGAKEDEITVGDVTSKSKALKNVFESNLGFKINIGKKRSRVVLIPNRWVEKEKTPPILQDFMSERDSYKDVHLVTDVHRKHSGGDSVD